MNYPRKEQKRNAALFVGNAEMIEKLLSAEHVRPAAMVLWWQSVGIRVLVVYFALIM